MISIRSKIRPSAGLALAAAIVLVSASCQLFRGSSDELAPAVKADGSANAGRSSFPGGDPEYVEGDVAPEIPAALPEERPKAPSASHVWIAGQHARKKGKWIWVPGHYAVPPSPEQVWVPGHWVDHLHGHAWIPGAWR
jgi:hypothetical protein